MEFRRLRVSLWVCFAVMLAATGALQADPIDLKDLDVTVFAKLRAKATQHVEVTLDGSLLKMAASFITSSGDDDFAKIKRLVSGLTSVTIRNFEFKKAGDYNGNDLDAIRNQVKLSDWRRIVETANKDDHESSEVYILPGKDRPQGLFVITAEPLELTVVHIMGAVDLKDIAALEHLRLPGDSEDEK